VGRWDGVIGPKERLRCFFEVNTIVASTTLLKSPLLRLPSSASRASFYVPSSGFKLVFAV
jgi:hypothetical protein